APDPALHARPARPRRDRAARWALPRARGRAAGSGPSPRGGEGRRARVLFARLPGRGRVLGPDRAGEGARGAVRRADQVGRRAPRSEGRLSVPDVVRPVVDVPGAEVVSAVVEETRAPNEE